MYARAARLYRSVDVESAPKEDILDRLFERCLRDIDAAAAGIVAKDANAKGMAIDHASQIVTELLASLDHKVAPDMCANLASLYDYVLSVFVQANLAMDAQILGSAREVIAQIRGAFREAQGR